LNKNIWVYIFFYYTKIELKFNKFIENYQVWGKKIFRILRRKQRSFIHGAYSLRHSFEDRLFRRRIESEAKCREITDILRKKGLLKRSRYSYSVSHGNVWRKRPYSKVRIFFKGKKKNYFYWRRWSNKEDETSYDLGYKYYDLANFELAKEIKDDLCKKENYIFEYAKDNYLRIVDDISKPKIVSKRWNKYNRRRHVKEPVSLLENADKQLVVLNWLIGRFFTYYENVACNKPSGISSNFDVSPDFLVSYKNRLLNLKKAINSKLLLFHKGSLERLLDFECDNLIRP
jgi:hypothetical protein